MIQYLLLLLVLTGCSLSFQNISTHGSTDMEDAQEANPDVKPNVSIPVNPKDIYASQERKI